MVLGAIEENADLLRYHAYRYLPLESSGASRRSNLEVNKQSLY
jgi:hypothetical protein